METTELLEHLFEQKKLKILRLFLQDKEKEFYLREISNLTKVPVASVFRIIQKLLQLDLIQEMKVNKFKLYKAADNANMRFLENFVAESRQIIKTFVQMVSGIKGLNMIILHGKIEKDRANLLMIGEDIDVGEVKRICAEIKEKHNYIISFLNLTEEQFTQMSSMGLYSGEKKIVFRR
jgi:hypothetical protein